MNEIVGLKAITEIDLAVVGTGTFGMTADSVMDSPRMGAIFGRMLLSGRRAAELTMDLIKN